MTIESSSGIMCGWDEVRRPVLSGTIGKGIPDVSPVSPASQDAGLSSFHKLPSRFDESRCDFLILGAKFSIWFVSKYTFTLRMACCLDVVMEANIAWWKFPVIYFAYKMLCICFYFK